MIHTITIILQFEVQKAHPFEKLFEAEILPLWHEFKADGKFIGASLSRIVDGDNLKPDVQQYVLNVQLQVEEVHDEFDTDPRFLAFLERARPMQPAEPLVRIGELVFEV